VTLPRRARRRPHRHARRGGRLALQLVDANGDGSLDLIVQPVVHGKHKKKFFDAATLAQLPAALAWFSGTGGSPTPALSSTTTSASTSRTTAR
jgi:hypothetical protein